jgi:hypothetical protein
MFKKTIVSILIMALVISLFVFPVFGASGQVTVTIPAFPVTLNGLSLGNKDRDNTYFWKNTLAASEYYQSNYDIDYARYPFIVYRDITYFPMTYYQSNLLNLNTSWTAESGLVITKGNPETHKLFMFETPISNRNSRIQAATIVDSRVTVNGKVIDNSNEPYPLLLFRDVTYFPMTWRFAVEEFGWSYTFDNTAGLSIKADNFFRAGFGETYYIQGDLMILLKTERGLGGVFSPNLYIQNGDFKASPDGAFGYGQSNPPDHPVFTVEGGFIHTTYAAGGFDADSRPVRVNIKTGEALFN